MSGTGEGAERVQSPVSLVLAMRPGQDRTLLEDWLSRFAQYRVRVARTPPTEGEYDLCLLDRATWRDHKEHLRDRKAAADPVFLPHMLLVTGEAEEWSAVDVASVDDVIALPVERAVLHRRIENLLRARRASLRLREREEQYERLVELAPEGILIVSDGRIRYANWTAVDLLGAGDADSLIGRSLHEYVGANSETRVRELCNAVGAGERSREFVDVRFETAADGAVETAVAAVGVTYEGDRAVQLLVRDLTEQQQRERRLDLLGRAVEAAAQGITVADADQDDTPLIYANEAFERITGYGTAEIVGRNCRFLQGDRTDEETVATIRDVIDAERSVSVEILNYRKDGTPFWNQLDIVPVTDGDGDVTHFLGLQRDVTERREREERLTVLNRVLRHNLRNRLNVVQGYAERVLSAAGGEEEGKGVGEKEGSEIREAATHIRDAVEELLAISDRAHRFQHVISSSPRELRTHDLVATVERAVEGFRTEHPDATVELALPAAAAVRGNETLPLAVGELLDLAAQSPGTTPDLDVRAIEEGDWITVEVVDRGRTIPAADLAVLSGDTETATEHPQGVGAWLLRWVTLYSNGGITVDADGPPTIQLRFRPAGDGGSGDATG